MELSEIQNVYQTTQDAVTHVNASDPKRAAKDIGRAFKLRSEFLSRNEVRGRLAECWNVGSNTIPAGLKRAAILQAAVVDFARRTMVLNAFSTVFGNVPLLGTNKVEVPCYSLDASASTSWDPAVGYAAGDTTTDVREIQIGSNGGNAALLCDRKYQGLSFTSEELERQPFIELEQLARLKAEKLASDIVAHVMSIITAANFGAAGLVCAAAAISSEDIADLKEQCKLWDAALRSLVLDSAYDTTLLKDNSIKLAMNYGGPEAIRNGQIPMLLGFRYYENPTIPDNGENLVGFAVHKGAIGFAQAPVLPAAEVRNAGTTWEMAVSPSGVALEYRAFGDNTLDTAKRFIEASYGFAKLNGNALKRITSQ